MFLITNIISKSSKLALKNISVSKRSYLPQIDDDWESMVAEMLEFLGVGFGEQRRVSVSPPLENPFIKSCVYKQELNIKINPLLLKSYKSNALETLNSPNMPCT